MTTTSTSRSTVLLVSLVALVAVVAVVLASAAGVVVGARLVHRADPSSEDASGGAAADEAAEAAIPVGKAPPLTCRLFPEDSYWHADVSKLPVHPMSSTYMRSIGVDARLHPDFGSGHWDGVPIGIPYATVKAGQPTVPVSFEYADESDPGPYPIPRDVPIEQGAGSDGDRHVLIVDEDACRLHELYDARPKADGTWTAGSGATFDLRSNRLRPAGFTSADGSGMAILPGLVRYDEVAAGEIDHAIRFTAKETRDQYVWPARHRAGKAGPNLPPMGSWLRLKSGVDISGFPEPVQVILRAMKVHGLILADNGSSMFFTGVQDERWDNEVLSAVKAVTGGDFEVVDAASLMISADSGAVRR
jgi:hypothetical protein